VSDSEPFYVPDDDVIGHSDAHRRYATYAAKLEQTGLASRFPAETDVRHMAIEMLADQASIHAVRDDQNLIDDAVAAARAFLEERRKGARH
jgi:hypothetical protein